MEQMMMTVEGSLSAPPSCSEWILPLPDGNPLHLRAYKPLSLPKSLLPQSKRLIKIQNQYQPHAVNHNGQQPLENPQLQEQPSMIIQEPLRWNLPSLKLVHLLVNRLKPLKGGSQTNVREQGEKAELRAQCQVNSVQKKEDDHVKATLPPPTMISLNVAQSSPRILEM